ncbi:glutathione S-transferase family protein [Desertibaculum subflavum]|uniref:glutathione S-transferase family protein n=1 Tax=Desertibaculum subflavum TaxID=2268458 RepID=UPI0034D32CC0
MSDAGGCYRLIGINSSPYSVKVRAMLRYRRIPFLWVRRDAAASREIAHIRPAVIPVLQTPDGEYLVDSTPMALELERRVVNDRSILPEDPAQAFLALLIEDFADEWVTKAMFHYRWWYEADRRFAAGWVIGDRLLGAPRAEREAAGAAFNDRQVGRMALVGCTAGNRPLIEAGYRQLLAVLERGFEDQPFLFGTRPSIADFALYGQLMILATDPTPAAVMRAEAPSLLPWLLRLDDLSGHDGAWLPTPSRATTDLLDLVGRCYLPFLAANAAAFAEGREAFEVELDGHPYRQGTFRYQVKCLDTLRHCFAALPTDARRRLEPLLSAAGCLNLLSKPLHQGAAA